MASKRQRKDGAWEYQFQRKDLLKRVYRTFDTEREGDSFAARVEEMLDRGVVPHELLTNKLSTIGAVLDLYEVMVDLAPSSTALLLTLHKDVGKKPVRVLDNVWVDEWVDDLKKRMAPSTAKKRVELLARCIDWAMRKNMVALTQNPLRCLPKGYFTTGVPRDSWVGQRDRRLSEDGKEESEIRKVLQGREEHLIFDMALESAMRLREMYTLTRDQINLNVDTIFLDRTKNGDKRQVPISSVLKKLLVVYLEENEGDRLFSWWDGTLEVKYLDNLSSKVSQRFARRFEKAGCADLHFHDLRHEATSRIYERTTLTDLEVAAITGHKDPRMLKRYANLRGSKLAKKLW